MLYKILKVLLYFAIHGYFRSITIKNKDVVPAKGPVILAANHPGSFMDPLNIAVHLPNNLCSKNYPEASSTVMYFTIMLCLIRNFCKPL